MSNSLMYWVVVGFIVILATVVIIWLRHNFKIKRITFKTGPVETELERNQGEPERPASDTSINISGNKLTGWNRIFVRREKTNVSGNIMRGKNKIEVGAKPGPTPKRNKTGGNR